MNDAAQWSRSVEPLDGTPRGAAIGTWGLWLAFIVVAMFLAGLAAGALYLETGQPRVAVTGEPATGWPPSGIDVPGRGRAVLATLTAVAAAVAASLALFRLRRSGQPWATALLTLGVIGQLVALLILVDDLRRTPFHWGEHAFASVHWTITGTAVTMLGVGILVAGAVLIQLLLGVVDRTRHLELVIAVHLQWFAALTTAGLLGLIHLLALVGGEP